MANVAIIFGDYSSGKSASIKHLPPEQTFIIKCVDKPLPFYGSSNIFNKQNKNCVFTDKWNEIITILKEVVDKNKDIKYLVLDDFGYSMTSELFSRSSEKGYDKFTDIGVHTANIIKTCASLREDLCVAIIFHEENENSDKIITKKKIKTIGNLLEDKYNPLGTVSVALYADVKFEEDGSVRYRFITNRTKINGVDIPAKSPQDMFSTIEIENNLFIVFTSMKGYYDKV
jgi:hypothetical protein